MLVENGSDALDLFLPKLNVAAFPKTNARSGDVSQRANCTWVNVEKLRLPSYFFPVNLDAFLLINLALYVSILNGCFVDRARSWHRSVF